MTPSKTELGMGTGGEPLPPVIDLSGCEYLGGCPTVGPQVLNKVRLQFDREGLTVAIAAQGLFTLATARPVLFLAWPEINVLSVTTVRSERMSPALKRLVRSVVNVLTMRLDLPDQLTIGTPAWTMTFGVRVGAAELATALQDLLARRDGPSPVVTAS
jgi:hypothetical protein